MIKEIARELEMKATDSNKQIMVKSFITGALDGALTVGVITVVFGYAKGVKQLYNKIKK